MLKAEVQMVADMIAAADEKLRKELEAKFDKSFGELAKKIELSKPVAAAKVVKPVGTSNATKPVNPPKKK